MAMTSAFGAQAVPIELAPLCWMPTVPVGLGSETSFLEHPGPSGPNRGLSQPVLFLLSPGPDGPPSPKQGDRSLPLQH